MPAKFIRCVKKVKRQHRRVNPYAVCRASTGYYGTTHGIGLKHKIVRDKYAYKTSAAAVDELEKMMYSVARKKGLSKQQALNISKISQKDRKKILKKYSRWSMAENDRIA